MNYLDTLNHMSLGVAYLIIFLILFFESGLLIGFFLPGDTLVFPLGLLVAQGHFSLFPLFLICTAGAFTGDLLGYAIGRKLGPSLLHKKDSVFFKQEHIRHSRQFFERYGKQTILVARFVPILRTFAPTLAGVGDMEYRTFLLYNFLGGALWSGSLLVLGYYLERIIPDIDQYLLPVIIVAVVITLIASARYLLKQRKGV